MTSACTCTPVDDIRYVCQPNDPDFKHCSARFHTLSWMFENDCLLEEDDWESTIDSIMYESYGLEDKRDRQKIIAICKEDIDKDEESEESTEENMNKDIEVYLEEEAQKIDKMLDRLLRVESHHPYGCMREVIKNLKFAKRELDDKDNWLHD